MFGIFIFERKYLTLYFVMFYSHEHIEILTVNGELLFFRQREGPFYPTLRLLHKCKSCQICIWGHEKTQKELKVTSGS